MGAAVPMLPGWVRSYIGLPFRLFGRDRTGVDCWGLVALVLRERFGFDVPSHGVRYCTDEHDLEAMEAFIAANRAGWRAVATAQEGDVVLLRIYGRACHCGVMVTPDWFLHCTTGVNAALEKLDGSYWRRDRHVAGFWRWEGCHAV